MAALSAATTRKFEGAPRELSPVFAGNDTYYRGAIVCYNSDGLAAVPSDTAALFPAGIVAGKWEDGEDEYAHAIANGSTERGTVYRGKVWLPLGSAAQTDVGEYAYISDDNTLTQTAGSKTVVLVILDVDTTNALVLVDLDAAFVA